MTESKFWMALCAYHEARGEPWAGIKGVIHVIRNRAVERQQSVKEVILSPKQFSWANDGNRPAIDDYASFQKCMKAVDAVEMERLDGFTFSGANHYYADYIRQPSWAKCMEEIDHIGQHIFLRG